MVYLCRLGLCGASVGWCIDHVPVLDMLQSWAGSLQELCAAACLLCAACSVWQPYLCSRPPPPPDSITTIAPSPASQVLTRADPGNVEMLGFWELYHKHLGTSPRVAQQHLAKIYAVRDKTPSNHRRLAGLSHELGTWAQHMSNEEKVAFLDRYVVGR